MNSRQDEGFRGSRSKFWLRRITAVAMGWASLRFGQCTALLLIRGCPTLPRRTQNTPCGKMFSTQKTQLSSFPFHFFFFFGPFFFFFICTVDICTLYCYVLILIAFDCHEILIVEASSCQICIIFQLQK